GRTAATAASKFASSPPARIRSPQPRTWGERYEPTVSPASASRASVSRVVVDLPFVPTMWIAGNRSCGSPSPRSSARMRSVPKPSRGHGLGARIHAVLSAEGIELGTVLLELLALALDDLGCRVRDELLVRKHPLAALDLLA